MDIREFEFLHTVINERRAELQHDLEVEALLAETGEVSGTRRRILLSVAIAAVLVVVIIASSTHLFI